MKTIILTMLTIGSLSAQASTFKCINQTSQQIIEFHEDQPATGLATIVSVGQSAVVKLTISSSTIGRTPLVLKTFFHPYYEFQIKEVYGESNTRTTGMVVQSTGSFLAEMQEPQSLVCESIFQKIGQ